MIKNILAVTLGALLMAGYARSEDKTAPTQRESLMTYFGHLKSSLAQSAVQGERKKARRASVAAVRGKSQASELADPDETSLKGDLRAKRSKQAMAEDAEFESAVSLILAGKSEEGVKALEAFRTNHPKSRSLVAVEEALEKAKALAAAKPAAAQDGAPAQPAPSDPPK